MYDRKPIIKSIQEFVMICPYFQEGVHNTLADPELKVECSVDPVNGETVYRKYTDGSLLRQYLFNLTSKNIYDADSRNEIAATGFSQCFEEWLEQQNQNEVYPLLDGYTPVRTETISSGYLDLDETGLARYQIQCRLIYK